MDPRLRTAILLGGIFFCLVFAAMTATVVAQSSFDILALVSFLIIGMVLLGLIGAIRNPPNE